MAKTFGDVWVKWKSLKATAGSDFLTKFETRRLLGKYNRAHNVHAILLELEQELEKEKKNIKRIEEVYAKLNTVKIRMEKNNRIVPDYITNVIERTKRKYIDEGSPKESNKLPIELKYAIKMVSADMDSIQQRVIVQDRKDAVELKAAMKYEINMLAKRIAESTYIKNDSEAGMPIYKTEQFEEESKKLIQLLELYKEHCADKKQDRQEEISMFVSNLTFATQNKAILSLIVKKLDMKLEGFDIDLEKIGERWKAIAGAKEFPFKPETVNKVVMPASVAGHSFLAKKSEPVNKQATFIKSSIQSAVDAFQYRLESNGTDMNDLRKIRVVLLKDVTKEFDTILNKATVSNISLTKLKEYIQKGMVKYLDDHKMSPVIKIDHKQVSDILCDAIESFKLYCKTTKVNLKPIEAELDGFIKKLELGMSATKKLS